MSNGSLRYWISWDEPGADHRPMVWPLPPEVQYWCSGFGVGYSTLCAVVDVNGTEESAKEIIQKYWKPAEWRFCHQLGWTIDRWMPDPSRFPPRKST